MELNDNCLNLKTEKLLLRFTNPRGTKETEIIHSVTSDTETLSLNCVQYSELKM
jgi:hypothetical protein